MRSRLFGEVHIHLGGHRTGSTTFQMMLSENADAIRAQGVAVAFPGRGQVPNGQWALQLKPLPGGGPAKAKRRQQRIQDDISGHIDMGLNAQSILSDENLIGGMSSFERGAFYPAARRRMSVLRKALKPAAVGNVLLMIRPYDSLFVSAFRKRAEVNALPDYAALRNLQSGFEGGWPTVVDDILTGLRPKRLFVVSYGRSRDDVALLQKLCPKLDVAQFRPHMERANASYSDAALFDIPRRLHAGERLTRDEARAISEQFADRVAAQPFAAMTPEQAAGLQRRYTADLGQLRAHSGITFVEA